MRREGKEEGRGQKGGSGLQKIEGKRSVSSLTLKSRDCLESKLDGSVVILVVNSELSCNVNFLSLT